MIVVLDADMVMDALGSTDAHHARAREHFTAWQSDSTKRLLSLLTPTDAYPLATARHLGARLVSFDRNIMHAATETGLARSRRRWQRSLHLGSYRTIYQLTDSGETARVAAIRQRGVAIGPDRR